MYLKIFLLALLAVACQVGGQLEGGGELMEETKDQPAKSGRETKLFQWLTPGSLKLPLPGFTKASNLDDLTKLNLAEYLQKLLDILRTQSQAILGLIKELSGIGS